MKGLSQTGVRLIVDREVSEDLLYPQARAVQVRAHQRDRADVCECRDPGTCGSRGQRDSLGSKRLLMRTAESLDAPTQLPDTHARRKRAVSDRVLEKSLSDGALGAERDPNPSA